MAVNSIDRNNRLLDGWTLSHRSRVHQQVCFSYTRRQIPFGDRSAGNRSPAGGRFAKCTSTLGGADIVTDEQRYLEPRSLGGMLEVLHFHSFAMGILLLTLTHLLLFVPMPKSWKAWGVSLSFGSALAGEAAGWLVRFVAPWFAYLKIAAFLTLQATLAFLVGAVLWVLVTGQPNDYRSGSDDEDDDQA